MLSTKFYVSFYQGWREMRERKEGWTMQYGIYDIIYKWYAKCFWLFTARPLQFYFPHIHFCQPIVSNFVLKMGMPFVAWRMYNDKDANMYFMQYTWGLSFPGILQVEIYIL